MATHKEFVDRRGNIVQDPRNPNGRNLDPEDFMTPDGDYDICCPNCNARGDFMQEVNKVLRNCIDFCEFPHRCWNQQTGNYEIIWKTLGELQAHS